MLTCLSLVSIAWLIGMSPGSHDAAPVPSSHITSGTIATTATTVSTSGNTPDLVLFVYPARLSPGRLREVMRVGTDMLAGAGLHIAWVDCVAAPEACIPGEARAAVVRFTNKASWRGDGCGWAVMRPGSPGRGLVSLDMDCVNEFAVSLRNRADRVVIHPPHLMGALLAHEVGHVVGLDHGAKGLMGCTVGVAEWRALTAGRLQFSAAERKQIAAATRQPSVVSASR